jgi:AraC-like DNA-binding protein
MWPATRLMSSQTLAEGFQRLVRYQRIIAESADLSFRLLDEGYALILTVHGDHLPPTRQSAEASLACALALCGWLTGRTLQPRKVLVQGDQPANLEPYKQAFHAPLVFNAAYDALIFERADMEAPLPTANEAMAQLHDRFAGEYLARFSESRVTHKARQVLCRLLPQGEPKRDAVAQTLHLSQRTLQRRLQEEGTSFQTLLDDTRRELAEQYLAQPTMTLLEIAYLLGFADPSNFFRAFRRWFDTTPGEYRARLTQGASSSQWRQNAGIHSTNTVMISSRPKKHAERENPLGGVRQGGEVAGRADGLAQPRADAGHCAGRAGQGGHPVHAQQRQQQRDHADGDGEEERKGQDRTHDLFVEPVTVVLLLDHRARVNQLIKVGLEQDVGHLEAENLDPARGRAGAAADENPDRRTASARNCPTGCSPPVRNP